MCKPSLAFFLLSILSRHTFCLGDDHVCAAVIRPAFFFPSSSQPYSSKAAGQHDATHPRDLDHLSKQSRRHTTSRGGSNESSAKEDKTRAAGLGNAAAKATSTSVWVWGQEPKASAGTMGRKQRQETKAVVTAGAGVTAAADEGAGKNVSASVDERKKMFADVKSGSSCRYVTLGGGAWQDRYADKDQTLRSSFRAAALPPRATVCVPVFLGPLRVCAFFVRARVSSSLFFWEKGWCGTKPLSASWGRCATALGRDGQPCFRCSSPRRSVFVRHSSERSHCTWFFRPLVFNRDRSFSFVPILTLPFFLPSFPQHRGPDRIGVGFQQGELPDAAVGRLLLEPAVGIFCAFPGAAHPRPHPCLKQLHGLSDVSCCCCCLHLVSDVSPENVNEKSACLCD